MKPKPKKSRGGRPSNYRAEYAKQAYKLCLLGATDADIADFFGVTETTINNWKSAHPEFFESLKAGKAPADATVAASLYRRATGYRHRAVKIFNANGVPLVVPYTEIYAPDTTAAIFWLKNRRPDLWRDKQDHEHSGPEGGPVEMTITHRVVDPAAD